MTNHLGKTETIPILELSTSEHRIRENYQYTKKDKEIVVTKYVGNQSIYHNFQHDIFPVQYHIDSSEHQIAIDQDKKIYEGIKKHDCCTEGFSN